MARIAGVNIPTNKRVEIALRYIHGIGPVNAKVICKQVNIASSKRVNELSDAEVLQIREIIDRDYVVEGDLRREVAVNIKRLMDLGTYRGFATARACRPAASVPTAMPAPARARPRPSPAGRNKEAKCRKSLSVRAAKSARTSPRASSM